MGSTAADRLRATSGPAPDLDALAEAVSTIAPDHGRLLKFPPLIERSFQVETGPARRQHLKVTGLIAILTYLPFLPIHLLLMPDAQALILLVQLALQIPFSILALRTITRVLPTFVRESIAAVVATTGSLVTMAVCAGSHAPMALHCIYGVGLVLVFCNILLQVRFRYALASTLCIETLSMLPDLQPADATPELRLWLPFYFACIGLFTLVCSYQLERGARSNWLASLRERLDSEALKRANALLREISGRDPLTGLANRRTFDAALSETLAGPPGWNAVVMIDIDQFKLFNDRYGHPAGDSCLRQVGALLAASVRPRLDTLARYGGEEFVVVMPGTDPESAARRAERLRAAVEAFAIPHGASRTGVVTVSVGVGAQRGPVDAEVLIAAADGALYAAKRAGRNGVCVRAEEVQALARG